MKNIFFLFIALTFFCRGYAQNVGIGTIAPICKLNIIGPYGSPSIPGAASTGIFRIGVTAIEGIDFGKLLSSPHTAWIQSGFNGITPDPLSLQPAGGNLGIGTTTPSASAALDVVSTTKGFLPPRMTSAQRNSIAAPVEGLVIYNTTTKCLQWYDGTGWYDGCTGATYIPNICNPSNPTIIVPVTNPATGKTWMDRNLGANRAATSSTDTESYGSLFQWGRGADGHQCVNRYAGDGVTTSGTTTTIATTAVPNAGNSWDGLYITTSASPNDWLTPQDVNLWQAVNGVNNPCPNGYRLPTNTELNNERLSWSSNNVAGAFASPLKWALAGFRTLIGTFTSVGSGGFPWSSTVAGSDSGYMQISGGAYVNFANRAYGLSVRCLKD